ncbi:hypothetical protein IAR55_000662 [Kwoniella newhampshirensis]|uniref:Uncharacterized protein n=1 Tax=Kwoniella newhampshirensis TaxID=1651941 RepID=A0AAW0Z795_9TREE
MSSSSNKDPVNLISVNTFPDRANKVIGSVIEVVKDKYTIVHAGNSTTIEGVRSLLESTQPPPGILFAASMWTPEQQAEIQQIAKDTIPEIKTHAIPSGLQQQVGVEGVIRYLVERIDEIMATK